MTTMQKLDEGGIDGGGSYVEYDHGGHREQGWVLRCWNRTVQIETFSGDYLVTHHVERGAIWHVFSEAELAAAEA